MRCYFTLEIASRATLASISLGKLKRENRLKPMFSNAFLSSLMYSSEIEKEKLRNLKEDERKIYFTSNPKFLLYKFFNP